MDATIPFFGIEECRLHLQPLIPFLRPPSAVVLVLNCPPFCLRRVSYIIATTPPLPFRHQGLPVANHCVHHHIEDGGRQWVTLGDASIYAEGFSVLPTRLRHHLQPLPIPVKEAEEGYQRLKVKAAFFYAKNGMVASTDPGLIQSVFDTLTGIFDQVGLQKKFRKTMWVV